MIAPPGRALGLVACLVLSAAAAGLLPGAAAAAGTRIVRAEPDLGTGRHSAPRARAASVNYGGGPVQHTARTHVIFWQPAGSGLAFEPGYGALVETFLSGVAADSHLQSNVFALVGQYAAGGASPGYGASYAGAVFDTNPLPVAGCVEPAGPPLGSGPGWTACVSDAQIEHEISSVVAARRLPATFNDVYLLVTPRGLGSCYAGGPSDCALGGSGNNGFCGYHQTTADGILYAVIPYNAVPGHCQSDNPRPNGSPADPTISTIAHEQAEVATDPLNNAWLDSANNEIGDLCITNYGPALGGSSGESAYDQVIHGGRYYLQELWSNADGRCMAAAPADQVSFAARSTVAGDRPLSFRGNASAAHGLIVAYRWFFGDGRAGRQRTVSHAFTTTGARNVTLRSTDSWGNWAFATRRIEVGLPSRPTSAVSDGPRRTGAAPRSRFRFSSNAPIASFECHLDDRPWVACRSPFTTPKLAAGGHAFSVRARDAFGQLGPASARYRFTVA